MTMSEPALEPRPARGLTRGWCPGVLDPMETGDGWLLRIRVPGGLVTSSALASVAALAGEFGSGIVDITSRANLQIRGVAAHRLDLATAAAAEAGLAGADPGREAFRAVVANPLTGHDQAAACDSRPVVAALVARLVDGIAGNAPSKFGIVVDDCGSWPLDGLDADVALRATRDGSWQICVRGTRAPIGSTDDPVGSAVAATQWCVDEQIRMDQLVTITGIATVAARLAASTAHVTRAATPPLVAGRILGMVPHAHAQRVNVVAAPFLGRVTHQVLIALAGLAATHAADLRLTPDHSFAFCGLPSSAAQQLMTELGDLGLVVDRDDPKAAISACVGSAGCWWAHADTGIAAAELVATDSTPGGVHLSACAKQCGAPSGVRQLVADESGTFR
ncbi:MAG: cobG [Ilumatobacteraceae bacterium]|nr:cobG [Ilumatobacteraceae bacterium]